MDQANRTGSNARWSSTWTATLVVAALAAGCRQAVSPQSPASALVQIEPTAEVIPEAAEPADDQVCQEEFEQRELREPYQRREGEQPRFTLSSEKLAEYLDVMRIRAICIPPAFGSPFLNVDWNQADLPATGRMVSLGFEDLYAGGGWSKAYLLYATYDFEIGSEYEVFASGEDYRMLLGGELPASLEAGEVEGFIRYHAGIPMGGQVIMKTYVFPFADAYLAGVVNLGVYDAGDVEQILAEMEQGTHPDLDQDLVREMDALVDSLQLRP